MSPVVIVSGLLSGALYALVGLGISLVFGVLRIMNLAHGLFVIGGAYIASLAIRYVDADPLVVLPLSMLAMAVIAYPLQRFLLTDLARVNPAAPLVATFGVALVGEATLQAGFGIDPQSLAAPYATAGVTIVGVRVQAVYLVAAALSTVLCVATHAILTWTRAGMAVRAASADPVTASLLGIDVDRVFAATFAGSAALAAAAGVMVGTAQSFTPSAGTSLLLIGFAVMALGGIGSVGGVLLAGLALGLFQSIAVSAFGGGWRNFVVYAVFFLALAARPNGLFRRAS